MKWTHRRMAWMSCWINVVSSGYSFNRSRQDVSHFWPRNTRQLSSKQTEPTAETWHCNVLFVAPRMVYCSIINLLWSLIVIDEYDVLILHLRAFFTYWCHVCCLRFSNYPAKIWGNTRDTSKWTRSVADRSKRRTHLWH